MEFSGEQIRLIVFLFFMISFAALETIWSDRPRSLTRLTRWSSISAMLVISTLLLRVMLPVALLSVASWADENRIGFLHYLPVQLSFFGGVVAFVLLDFFVWFQHWATHRVPLLWRIHRVHHTDVDVDVATALRFHPFELGLSLLYKALMVLAIGAPVFIVFLFEMVLSASAIFNHSNLKIPSSVDKVLRTLIVTPDMHRVHHSVHREESDTNFGSILPFWDHFFRTYSPHFKEGRVVEIGQVYFREPVDQRLDKLLLQPFHRERER